MIYTEGEYLLQLQITSTDLLAGTTQYLTSPVDGIIEEIEAVVQEAVGTGGTIKAQLGATDVAGSTLTVANSAAVGTKYNAATTRGDASCVVTKGQAIKIVVDSAFATTGAVNLWLRVVGGK